MFYNKILLMLPTYHRPLSILSFLSSVYATVENIKNIRFCFCVNVNDTETRDFLKSYNWHDPNCYEIIDEETIQPNLSLYFNLMFDKTKFTDAVVTELGDDMIFQTKNWDTIILQKINKYNGKTIVYCDDNYIAHQNCCVNLFTTREFVSLTKKPFMCEYFHADMIDVIWTMVGLLTGTLCYLENVKIQHNHSTKQSSELWDDTFKRLSPVQKICNSEQNHKLASVYATLCAKNLIENGVGKWNILQ
jgi:hypothetical protein